MVPPICLNGHVAPPSLEYSQVAVAFVSKLVNKTLPLLVMRSVALIPASDASLRIGAATAVSKVKDTLLVPLKLPAESVCLTSMTLVPSPLTVILVPVPALQAPPLTLYSHVERESSKPTVTTPVLAYKVSPTWPV